MAVGIDNRRPRVYTVTKFKAKTDEAEKYPERVSPSEPPAVQGRQEQLR